MKCHCHNTVRNASNEAPFLMSQFLNDAEAVDQDRLSEQERTLLLLYYSQLAGVLDALKLKRSLLRSPQ